MKALCQSGGTSFSHNLDFVPNVNTFDPILALDQQDL